MGNISKTNIIVGFIYFYLVAVIFSMFANLITYVSADVLLYTESEGEKSYLRTFVTEPETVDDEYAWEAVLYFMQTAVKCTPFSTFFDQATDSEGFGFLIDLIKEPKGTLEKLGDNIRDYVSKFPRDMAVAMLAAFVYFAAKDVKNKILGSKSIGAILGFYVSSVFWILASNTFANCLVTILEKRILPKNQVLLYVGLVVFAIAFEVVVHGYAKKCKVLPLVVLSGGKILISFFRSLIIWYICKLLFVKMQLFSVLWFTVMFWALVALEEKLETRAEHV